jgi:hypothetical protein
MSNIKSNNENYKSFGNRKNKIIERETDIRGSTKLLKMLIDVTNVYRCVK